LETARDLILATARLPGGSEALPVDRAAGRVLAADVVAREEMPRLPLSRVDGYALLAAATEGASPQHSKVLPVASMVKAGDPEPHALQAGTAVAITTGAPTPPGADAVLPLEEVVSSNGEVAQGGTIRVSRPARAGENVTPRGEHSKPGRRLLRQGEVIGTTALGLLASQGYRQVSVFLQPRVGILATGSELVPWPEMPGPSQIRCSNLLTLAEQVRQAGAIPVELPIAPDNLDDIKTGILQAISERDINFLLTTGGASQGPFDFTVRAMDDLGKVLFAEIAVRPGRGTAFTVLGEVPALSLPGGPLSARILFETLARPALLRMAGRQHVLREPIKVRVTGKVRWRGGQRRLVPVCVGNVQGSWVAEPQRARDFRCPGRFAGLLFLEGEGRTAGDLQGQVEVWDWPETQEWTPGYWSTAAQDSSEKG